MNPYTTLRENIEPTYKRWHCVVLYGGYNGSCSILGLVELK